MFQVLLWDWSSNQYNKARKSIKNKICQTEPVNAVLNIHFTVQRRPAGELVIPQVKAKEFLSAIRRPRRNLWDRSRPDVQQWIQQFMHMGYDEAVSFIKSFNFTMFKSKNKFNEYPKKRKLFALTPKVQSGESHQAGHHKTQEFQSWSSSPPLLLYIVVLFYSQF